MKLNSKLTVVSCLILGSISIAFANNARVSPFSDNLTVNLTNFPTSTFSYHSENSVNITGPRNAWGTTAMPVNISSNNSFDSGFPQMSWLATDGSSCSITFVDGPWTTLNFRTGTAPSCSRYSISPVYQDGQYQYHLDITYTG